MTRTNHLTRLVNTLGTDDPRLPMAKRLFKEMCVEARIRLQVERESTEREYMPPIPKFKVKKMKLTEAVRVALAWDVYKFLVAFYP